MILWLSQKYLYPTTLNAKLEESLMFHLNKPHTL